MKKIILGLLLFIGLYQGVFSASTLITNFGNTKPVFINGNNVNGVANTNSIILTTGYFYTGNYFLRRINLYNYAGSSLGSIDLGDGFQNIGNSGFASYGNNGSDIVYNIIDGLNYTIILGYTYTNTFPGLGSENYGLYYNKTTGTIHALFYRWNNGANIGINYTFNDTSILINYGGTSGTFNLSTGLAETNIIPVNGYNFSVSRVNTFYVNQNNSWYTKGAITNDVVQFYYDSITDSVLSNTSPLNSANVNLFKMNFLDLNEFVQSENYNSYLSTFGSGVSSTYTGFLSYSTFVSTGIHNFKLLPPPSEIGLIDYNILTDSLSNTSNLYPQAWWAGTGSTERLYYLSGSELYFNGSAGLVTTYTTSTGTTVIDTAQSVGSTNTGGFITFNNTGTGGSLSTLFANANAGSGSFLPDKLNFLFTSASTKVNSGGLSANCTPMFDVDGVFNYTKNAQSTFLINLSNGNILSLGARWNMEILGVNVIGWLYDILDWLLTMIQQIFGTILNGFFGLFSDVTGAVNIPVRNANYCFLGTNIYLQDNIKSYYSYSQKKNINVSGLNSIEMFYIFLLTIFLFVLVIKL